MNKDSEMQNPKTVIVKGFIPMQYHLQLAPSPGIENKQQPPLKRQQTQSQLVLGQKRSG